MVEISVIMPAYNEEDHLDESLNSIINQSFKDLEIICVNDGSTDNTLDRLNEFASKDARIKVYSQENQGPGGASNTGLSKATGKYIYFMDADDILELNALEEFYSIMQENGLDFLLFRAIVYDEDTGEYYSDPYYSMDELRKELGGEIFDWRDIGESIFKICVTPWCKFYNHEFIKKTGAKFPLKLVYHDNIFFWEILFNSNKIYFYDKVLYTRRIHSSSCTFSFDERNIHSIETNNLIIQTFIKYGQFEKYIKTLYNNKIGGINTRYDQIRDEFKELFFTEMKKDYVKIIGHERYDEFCSELDRDCLGYFNNVINSENHVEYDLRNRILRLEIAYEDMANEIERLGRENKKLSELNEDILSSNSWKITGPLRKLRNR